MRNRLVFRSTPYLLVLGALATTAAGCYTMARVPARYITTEKPPEIFVRDAEGSVFALANPTIVQDSLVGSDHGDAVALNLREVDAMAIRQISKPKTAGAIAGGIGVLGMITFGVVKATTSKDCGRVANRNNVCYYDAPNCKYGTCEDGDETVD